jgi:pleiotropic regulator 1
MFASGSTDNIKLWKFPAGDFMQNLSGHNTMINYMAINEDGVLVSGGNVIY